MYAFLLVHAPGDEFTDFGLDRFASGVLFKSDMPAAMMEPLFMSNPAEAEQLVTPIYTDNGTTTNSDCIDCRRAQIAQAIHNGILSYFGAGGTNEPPTADFSHITSGLTVSFSDQSSDSDGSIVSWSWDFGDDETSTEQNPTHTYGAEGTYTVVLTVTDDDGATGTDAQDVTVSSGSGSITLTATGYKVRGLQKADLTWSGATSDKVEVYRDGEQIATTANDGFHADNIDKRGGGSYVYQVCAEGTSTCSNEATVTY